MTKTERDYYFKLLRQIAKTNKNIEQAYDTLDKVLALAGLTSLEDIDDAELFKFAPTTEKQISLAIMNFSTSLLNYFENGCLNAALLSEKKNNELFSTKIPNEFADKAVSDRRMQANEAWVKKRLNSINGLKLSQNVWNYASQYKAEWETALSVIMNDGIKKGISAEQLGRQVRSLLNKPDMMYRRYHRIITLKTGKKKKITEWRKKVIDENGKVRFIKTDLEKVGQGVYRSSRKNARRMAVTEINTAYRYADNERWKNEFFVLGMHIQLSGNHTLNGKPFYDICDELQGDYPKDFLWNGWHPLCRCTSTSILMSDDDVKKLYKRYKTKAEIMKHAPYPGTITKMPKVFKSWIKTNKKRIKAANERDTLPYFLRDNRKYWDKDYKPEITVKTAKEIAEERHAARTPEQIKSIKAMAAERQKKIALIKTSANNVLKTAKGYSEVDYSTLENYINNNMLDKMKIETKVLAKEILKMKQQEQALEDLIPDVHDWHKQFSIAEIKQVHDAVENKLSTWQNLSLQEQKKKLSFEAIDFLGGNMHNVQGKYTTWKVSQAAYLKKLAAVEDAIDWEAINALGQKLAGFKTKSTIFADLMFEADEAIVAKDKNLAMQKLAEAEQKMQQLQKAAQKKAAKKLSSGSSVSYDADAYSQKRKDAAMWAKDTQSADNNLRDKCGIVWQTASESEKDAIAGYTSSYHNINEPLRGIPYLGSVSQKKQGEARIPLMTNIISRSTYDFDMWVQRGDAKISLKAFGLSNYSTASKSELQALVGKTGTFGAFTSAGVAKGKGLGGEVIYNIYLPKGTQAMYAEPFSAFGRGSGRNWNGIDKQHDFGYESEIIIQRGTTFRVLKVERSGSTIFVDIEAIAQNPLPFPYVGGYPYL